MNARASVASGATLAANHTWWGAASGPHTSSHPSGAANAANGSATFAPFLMSPASICVRLVASAELASPNPAPANSSFTLTASLSDSSTGGATITSAQYNVSGQYRVLNPTGTYTVCVRGTDAMANVGANACTQLTTQAAATSTGTPSATVESTPTATAMPAAPATPAATAPPANDNGGGFQVRLFLIGIVVLLIILGLLLFVVLRRRDDQQ